METDANQDKPLLSTIVFTAIINFRILFCKIIIVAQFMAYFFCKINSRIDISS